MQEKKPVLPLAALKAAKPSTLIGQLRAVWPEVQVAFDAGHTARDVHIALNESGVPISYSRLTDYRSRFNKTGRSTLRATPLKPAPSFAGVIEAEGAAGREVSQLGNQIARKNLNFQPTVKIPADYNFNVRVNHDLLFESPYEAVQPVEGQSAFNLSRSRTR